MANLPRISVAIPTLNGARTLPRLIESVGRQTGVGIVEKVAIDSGSADGTCEILERGGFRVIRIPKAEFNHGSTRNRLVELTQAPYVALFSQDAVPARDDTLHELVIPLELSPNVSGAYARQIPYPGASRLDVLRVIRSRAGRRDACRAAGGDLSLLNPAALIDRCDFHNGASMVRRAGFVPFPAAEIAEDLLWARKNLGLGREIAFVPPAVVYHTVERPLADEWRRLGEEARVLGSEFGYRPIRSLPDAIAKGIVWGAGDAAGVWLTPGSRPVQSTARAFAMAWMRALSFWTQSR